MFNRTIKTGVLSALLVTGLLMADGQSATPLSYPFVSERTTYTNAPPVANYYFGSAYALSENFAVIGMRGAQSGDGGFMLYRKTPDTTW